MRDKNNLSSLSSTPTELGYHWTKYRAGTIHLFNKSLLSTCYVADNTDAENSTVNKAGEVWMLSPFGWASFKHSIWHVPDNVEGMNVIPLVTPLMFSKVQDAVHCQKRKSSL